MKSHALDMISLAHRLASCSAVVALNGSTHHVKSGIGHTKRLILSTLVNHSTDKAMAPQRSPLTPHATPPPSPPLGPFQFHNSSNPPGTVRSRSPVLPFIHRLSFASHSGVLLLYIDIKYSGHEDSFHLVLLPISLRTVKIHLAYPSVGMKLKRIMTTSF